MSDGEFVVVDKEQAPAVASAVEAGDLETWLASQGVDVNALIAEIKEDAEQE